VICESMAIFRSLRFDLKSPFLVQGDSEYLAFNTYRNNTCAPTRRHRFELILVCTMRYCSRYGRVFFVVQFMHHPARLHCHHPQWAYPNDEHIGSNCAQELSASKLQALVFTHMIDIRSFKIGYQLCAIFPHAQDETWSARTSAQTG
jgi:hypothetical protein